MAKQLVLQNLMKLAQGIGANPGKFMGTKTNISFLGKGPTKNPLFQGPLRGLESATEAQLGSRQSIIEAVEDAMGFATANKLNNIQIRALYLNLEGLNKIYNPPVLPMASITDMATRTRNLTKEGLGSLRAKTGDTPLTMTQPRSFEGGPRPFEKGVMVDSKGNPIQDTEWAKRFPKESHKFMGRPLKDKDFVEIDELVKRGKLPSAVDLPQKTYAARATMYRLLDEPATKEGVGLTLREIMSPQDLKMLLEGGGGVKGDMIAMFAKYFGNASARQIPTATTPAVIDSFAKQIIRRTDRMGRRIDDPFFTREDLDFAHGGLAHILQVPRRGRVVHPGGYAGISKRQKFINLAKQGGSQQDFIDLAASFNKKYETPP